MFPCPRKNPMGVQLPNMCNWFAKHQNTVYQKNRESMLEYAIFYEYLGISVIFFKEYTRFLVLLSVRFFA